MFKRNSKLILFSLLILASSFMALVCSCSAAAKKDYVTKTGPIKQEQGEGIYDNTTIEIEKFGREMAPGKNNFLEDEKTQTTVKKEKEETTVVQKTKPTQVYAPPELKNTKFIMLIDEKGRIVQIEKTGE